MLTIDLFVFIFLPDGDISHSEGRGKRKGVNLTPTALGLWKSPSRMNAKPRPIGALTRRGFVTQIFQISRHTTADATQILFVQFFYTIPFVHWFD